MKVILSVPDEGYSERHLMKVILSVTWWMLFKKRVVHTKLDIYVFISKHFIRQNYSFNSQY
jgi:hypothetical protein